MSEERAVTAGAAVDVLRAEGVRLSSIPGGHVIGVDDTPEIRRVLVRHEHASFGAAAGWDGLDPIRRDGVGER